MGVTGGQMNAKWGPTANFHSRENSSETSKSDGCDVAGVKMA